MRYLLILILSIFLFGDVSDLILKIENIENIHKKFLKINYNIFMDNSLINKIKVIKNKKLNQLSFNFKIFAIFNNKININGKWYKIGDYINEYKIVKITNNGVYLMKNSKLFYISITYNHILKVK